MRDYSMNELEEMQAKALERVSRMQLRSHAFLGQDDSSSSVPKPTAPKMQPQVRTEPPHKKETKSGRISLPLNLPKDRDLVYPSFKTHFGEENEKVQKEALQKRKAGFFDSILTDADESLLFCLLLLLKAEGNHENLLLAILYVLFA